MADPRRQYRGTTVGGPQPRALIVAESPLPVWQKFSTPDVFHLLGHYVWDENHWRWDPEK